jgi:hypothetical protein
LASESNRRRASFASTRFVRVQTSWGGTIIGIGCEALLLA